MIINLQLVPRGGMTVRGKESPAIIDIGDPGTEFREPIDYELNVDLVGHLLLVRGRLQTRVRFSCARCLKNVELPLKVPGFDVQKEVADPAGTIDLTDEIRTDIILALPLKPLCQPGCRGICPVCGQDLNEKQCGCQSAREDSPFAGL
ncbi:MAG: DUF177 domain-containing protein [PVC group bacterium]